MKPPISTADALSRRAFILGSAAVATAAWLPRAVGAGRPANRFHAYPFSLGVASGEPAADGFVIWTRLAPRPLDPDGGMTPEPALVKWQVAEDEAFARIVASGEVATSADWAHAVHVEVVGLRPQRPYWYRFQAGGELSPVGRAVTLPGANALPERLRFAFASCQKYDAGYYTAYQHLVREELELVVFLGDYIYENADDASAVRRHGATRCLTLDDYRHRYAIYKADPALQAAHALAPWIVTWDDHEVANDYAGPFADGADAIDPAAFLQRRAAAYRAYYEHMPLRPSARPTGPDATLYRRFDFGRLARFNVLDTRQYRTDQPPGPRLQAPGPRLQDPAGTILGAAQRDWLFAGLDDSPAAWNVLAQQVLMAPVDRMPGPDQNVDVDKWAGYEFERRRVLRHLRDHRIANPVVLTGDKHSNWVNELLLDFDGHDGPAAAVEFLGTSITSGGDGVDQPDYLSSLLAENPFVKYHNNERGYVRCEVTPAAWRADFRTVPYVTRQGAPITTRASIVLESGRSQVVGA